MEKSKLKNTNVAVGLLYHRFRFGLIGNLKVLTCRIFGHRLNNNPAYHWCERCGMVYEEIYHNIGDGYFMESGIIDKNLYDVDGNYKYSTEINGEEYPLRKPVFDLLLATSKERDELKGVDKC